MPRLLKRPEAESDLDEIWWYIAQDSPKKAYCIDQSPMVFLMSLINR